MPRTAKRPDRINLRLSREAKRKLERAAAYSDKTLTEFVTDVALRKADAVVRKNEVITLTPLEWSDSKPCFLVPRNRITAQAGFRRHARVVRRWSWRSCQSLRRSRAAIMKKSAKRKRSYRLGPRRCHEHEAAPRRRRRVIWTTGR